LESIISIGDGKGVASMEAIMPGNPKQCRQHALCCMLLAKEATTDDSKRTFQQLAQSWTRLAEELEAAEALLDALNAGADAVGASQKEAPASGTPGLKLWGNRCTFEGVTPLREEDTRQNALNGEDYAIDRDADGEELPACLDRR
jgi:hypothetical protein